MAIGRIHWPILVVTLAGAAHAVMGAAAYYSIEVGRTNAFNASLLYSIALFGVPFALWFGFTISMYVISSVLGGKPLMGHLIRGMGLSMIPLIPAYLVWAGGRYLVLVGVEYEDNPLRGIEHDWDYLMMYIEEAMGDPTYVGAMVVVCVLVLLTGLLASLMLKRAANLDTRKASIAGFVPTGAYAIYLLLNAFATFP